MVAGPRRRSAYDNRPGKVSSSSLGPSLSPEANRRVSPENYLRDPKHALGATGDLYGHTSDDTAHAAINGFGSALWTVNGRSIRFGYGVSVGTEKGTF
jgi:hypothetical protein